MTRTVFYYHTITNTVIVSFIILSLQAVRCLFPPFRSNQGPKSACQATNSQSLRQDNLIAHCQNSARFDSYWFVYEIATYPFPAIRIATIYYLSVFSMPQLIVVCLFSSFVNNRFTTTSLHPARLDGIIERKNIYPKMIWTWDLRTSSCSYLTLLTS